MTVIIHVCLLTMASEYDCECDWGSEVSVLWVWARNWILINITQGSDVPGQSESTQGQV